MKAFTVFSIAIFLSGCKYITQKNEYIILTNGFSMNPAEPRIGIEITLDSIYYCQEKSGGNGNYNYYRGDVDAQTFIKIKTEILKDFKSFKPHEYLVKDGQEYQMIYNIEDMMDTLLLESSFITKKQYALIEQIISLKDKSKFSEIKYHSFPEKLLKYKLPEPPPLDSIGRNL